MYEVGRDPSGVLGADGADDGAVLLDGLGVDQGQAGLGQGLEAEVASALAHSSCCSASTAPTRRMMLVRSGKMPTTSVRRRISRLRRSLGLLDQIWRHSS